MCRLKMRPGDELTVEGMEDGRGALPELPGQTEFYRARADEARHRARFLSQKSVITVGPVMAPDVVP